MVHHLLLQALPEVVAAVKGRCEVYLDGGVCRGTDAFKALALGARAVFIGRPYLWGLAHSGEKGVEHVITLLKDELFMAFQLCGAVTVNDITPSMIMHHQRVMSKL